MKPGLSRNDDGTILCSECGNSYDLHHSFENILSKMITSKKCQICKKALFEWFDVMEK